MQMCERVLLELNPSTSFAGSTRFISTHGCCLCSTQTLAGVRARAVQLNPSTSQRVPLKCSSPQSRLLLVSVQLQVCERVLLELNPSTSYTFPSYHAAIKAPYDYFAFGQRYIR